MYKPAAMVTLANLEPQAHECIYLDTWYNKKSEKIVLKMQE